MLKFLKSFVFAFQGIKSAFKSEFNFRFHFIAAILTIAAGFYFNITGFEWLVIILCIGLVITAELFNTAIEKIVNLVSPEYHPLAGQIKDIAAGAVLIIAITSLISGLIIFFPRIF